MPMIQDNISTGSMDGATSHLISCPQFTSVLQFLTPRVGLVLTFAIIAIILAVEYARSPWRNVPPGPKGLPLLGNVLELKDKAWLFEKDFKRKHRESVFVSASHCESRDLSVTFQRI